MKTLLTLLAFSVLQLAAQSSLNVTFQAQYTYPGKQCANICGYVDSTGREYALVGVETGMSVVDVTNPSSPVQIYSIPWPVNNQNSLWKEIKVYKKHAYVVSEAGSGLQICDLSKLPSPVPQTPVYWQPVINGQTLNTIHALHIDTTKGNVYLYGSTISNKGAVIGSLANPTAPVYLGKFDNAYVHDGYVDNDTLFACEINDGYMEIVDCSNKTSPQVLASVQTPLRFTHNSWLSPDKKTVFTTDEKTKSQLTSYDISNLANITLLDTVKALSSGSIIHNTHVRPDYFAVNSWYRDGFNIVDVSRPHNMIVTGYYDTYAVASGSGFDGAWGVYPFLPSGTIVVSNIGEGLFVFTPNYVRGCYLEGNVKDSVSLFNLQNVAVQIVGSPGSLSNSEVSGDYATGLAAAGTYTVQFSKAGYQTKIIPNVVLTNGVLTTLNTKLQPLGFGISPVVNEQTFLVGPTVFEDKLTLKYYLSNTDAAAAILNFVAFWAILFTGKHPRGFFNFQLAVRRWAIRVNARILNLADGYPAFGTDVQDPHVNVDVAYPEKLSIGKHLMKAFFGVFYVVIPHFFCLFFLMIGMGFVQFIAWWAVLITGKYPKGLHDYMVGLLRWQFRVQAYLGFLTDEYPKFSLKA